MSDLITHWGVFDDSRRLMRHDASVTPLFKEIIEEEIEYARLGAISRGGPWWIPHIVGNARDDWPSAGGEDEETARKKLAYALGGATHYAADVVMKALSREITSSDWHEGHGAMKSGKKSKAASATRDISAYFDICVFRKVYLEGEEEPFNSFLAAHNTSGAGRALEEFTRSLFQRALLSSHTISPDRDDFDGYMERLFAKVQRLYVDVEYYCSVFSDPDPEKMKAFGVETRFYREDDPVVHLARDLQRNGTVPAPGNYESALLEDANKGGYGRALAISLSKIRELSAYWDGSAKEVPSFSQKGKH